MNNKSFEELKEYVLDWADDKDLLHAENADKQFMKFIEEVFEFKSELDLYTTHVGNIYGDITDGAKEKAKLGTAVPKGVGVLTTICLAKNVLESKL